MTQFAEAMPHGDIREVFPDIFFVTGTMKTVLMGAHWHFSRNMIVVRDGNNLSLINAVRLSDQGLAQLDALGKVVNLIKIGSLHSLDDAFYKERYGATVWALPGMPHAAGVSPDRLLTTDGELPLSACSLFVFEHTKLPECILRIDREGGILIACDSLQNWLAPDAFFSDESRKMMSDMGFFQAANVGPVWMQVNDPKAPDFQRLNQLAFKHVLCGHGSPLLDHGQHAFADRFKQVFGI
jgi:hypothetical protein